LSPDFKGRIFGITHLKKSNGEVNAKKLTSYSMAFLVQVQEINLKDGVFQVLSSVDDLTPLEENCWLYGDIKMY